MIFSSFVTAHVLTLTIGFLLAFCLGAVANKTRFCTMGALSDWVNIGDTLRLRAWFLAIAVAMAGATLLEYAQWVQLDETFPPFRRSQLIWAENFLGGLLFGIGMILASGCGNRCLIRAGAGNLKSVLVLLMIALTAYFMMNPFPGTDQTLFTLLFYPWLRPLSVELSSAQDIGALLAGLSDGQGKQGLRLLAGLLVSSIILLWIFRSRPFRRSRDDWAGGIFVGLCIVAAWWLTSNVRVNVDGEHYALLQYHQEWEFLQDSIVDKPALAMSLSPQSYTFINPAGQTLGYVVSGFKSQWLTFGVLALLGVGLGSLAWALWTRTFRIEWFTSVTDVVRHMIGGVLMGLGGILALGCTIGQGITGLSTLALGSFIAVLGIMLGGVLTMKIQFYRMVYEEEASFMSALIASLVDIKLLPTRWRKLDKLD